MPQDPTVEQMVAGMGPDASELESSHPLMSLTPQDLRDAIEDGYDNLEPVRDYRNSAWAGFRSKHHRSSEGGKASALNLSMQQAKTLLAMLAFNNPGADATPQVGGLEMEAKLLSQMLNADAASMRLSDNYQVLLLDTIFTGFAINKIALKAGSMGKSNSGTEVDPGETFEEWVDLDDYAEDPTARAYRELNWAATRVRVNRMRAIQQRLFGRDQMDVGFGTVPNPHLLGREEAADIIRGATSSDSSGQRGRMSDMGEKTQSNVTYGTLFDQIELWEVYLRFEGTTYLVILPAEPGSSGVVGATDGFLAFDAIDGVEDGPLERLSLIPDVLCTPASVDAMQRDLATAADVVAAKIIRQVRKADNAVVYDPGEEALARMIRKGGGDGWYPGNPKAVNTVKFGGLLPEIIPSLETMMSWWNDQTAGMQSAAGLRDVGKTATAFSGLMSRVQAFLEYLRSRIEDFATRCLRRRAYFLVTNPNMQRVLKLEIMPGMSIPMIYAADLREGKFLDFTFKVQPYSMQFRDPAIQAQELAVAFTQVIPAIAQLGAMGIIDPRMAIRMYGRKSGMDGLDQIIPDPMLQQQATMGATQGSQMSSWPDDVSGRPIDATRSAYAPTQPDGPQPMGRMGGKGRPQRGQ